MGASVALAVLAFALIGPAVAAPVWEFVNTRTGRFHITAFPDEVTLLESGAEGPWTKTGFAFEPAGPGDVPVSRFVRTDNGAPQHFFTLDPGEVASLARPESGWLLEGIAFRAIAPTREGCPFRMSGGFFPGLVGTIPVFRLYAGDLGTGHRYTTSVQERTALRERGWRDEGIAFCVTGKYSPVLLKSFAFDPQLSSDAIGSPSRCMERLGSCLAVSNLPDPRSPAEGGPVTVARRFQELVLGLDSTARGPSPYASLAPHFQLRTSLPEGVPDERFFPWPHPLPETQLRLRFSFEVTALDAEPSSHAYGHTTIEFLDHRSGRSFYFNVLAYTATPLGGDGVGFDVNMGKPIVGASFGAESSFARAGLRQDGPSMRHGDLRIDRSEFQRIVDAARTLDPLLSGAPADYLVAGFRLKNETVGNARIGVGISGLSLDLMARGLP